MNICFETFGCRLNRAEALEDEAKCIAKGHVSVTDHSETDLFVIRACSVTSRAQHDCEKYIAHIKRKYPYKRVIVTGCIKGAQKFTLRGLSDDFQVPMATSRAYLKVQDGCSGKCTFCIVPKFRGHSRSEPFEQVLNKARGFIDAGYHEIVLTGCNLSLYADSGKRLPELLAALAELSDDCRIRLGSLEPAPIADSVIETIAAHENICNFIHVPVQSGSAKVLTGMARPYTIREVDDLLFKAVKLMPDVSLGCDLIAGFPGETDLDHAASQAFLRRHPFSNAHVFPYSKRPGTPAASMTQLSHELRSQRAHDLADLATGLRKRYAHTFKGKIVETIVEDEKHCGGWTAEYLWCEPSENIILDKRILKKSRRSKMRIKVTKVDEKNRLFGEIVH